MFIPGSEPHGAAVPARLSSPMDALGYIGHGKGPWGQTTYDFRENFVLPPLAPAPLAVFFPAPMSAHNVRRRSPEFVEAMLPPHLKPAGVTCPLGSQLTQAVPFWRAGWDSMGQYLPKVHSGLPIRAKTGFYFSPATSHAPGLVGACWNPF